MKKLVLLLASFCLMTAASAAYKDGTYEGQGDGNHGKMFPSLSKAARLPILRSSNTLKPT